jgi:recombinational DNA repair protein (RecF pathway)
MTQQLEICAHCGQPALRHQCLGVNGRFLCPECQADRDVLNAFLESAFRPAASALGAALRHLGRAGEPA